MKTYTVTVTIKWNPSLNAWAFCCTMYSPRKAKAVIGQRTLFNEAADTGSKHAASLLKDAFKRNQPKS